MKQTAVEWLIEHLTEYGFDLSHHRLEIEQAKEMEQQQGYNEEEVLDLLCARNIEFNLYEGRDKVEKWFEQFKNK